MPTRRPTANAALVARLEEIAASGTHKISSGSIIKACGSLSRYPILVRSGQQAAQLQHVGSAIADLINGALASLGMDAAAAPPPPPAAGTVATMAAVADVGGAPTKRRRKDAEQKRQLASAFGAAAGGTTPAGAALADLAAATRCTEDEVKRYFANSRRKAAARPAPAAVTTGVAGAGQAGAGAPAVPEAKELEVPPPAPLPGAAAGGGRRYVPKARTGNWAVLVALADHTVPAVPAGGVTAGGAAAGRPHLLKAELLAHAQPHCDSSFDPPPALPYGSHGGGKGKGGGGQYHTAWSGESAE